MKIQSTNQLIFGFLSGSALMLIALSSPPTHLMELPYEGPVFWNENSIRQYRNTITVKGNDVTMPASAYQAYEAIPKNLRKEIAARYKSCAIVGNSANLLGTGYGTAIDSKDAVFRLNLAPIEGYENDVGKRTTLRITDSCCLPHNPPESVMTSLAFLCYSTEGCDLVREQFLTSHVWQSFQTIYMVNNRFVQSLKDMMRPYMPSTGMFAVFLGLRMCENVSIYGFGADKNGNWDHYYNSHHMDVFKTRDWHKIDLERSILIQLENQGALVNYGGNRPDVAK